MALPITVRSVTFAIALGLVGLLALTGGVMTWYRGQAPYLPLRLPAAAPGTLQAAMRRFAVSLGVIGVSVLITAGMVVDLRVLWVGIPLLVAGLVVMRTARLETEGDVVIGLRLRHVFLLPALFLVIVTWALFAADPVPPLSQVARIVVTGSAALLCVTMIAEGGALIAAGRGLPLADRAISALEVSVERLPAVQLGAGAIMAAVGVGMMGSVGMFPFVAPIGSFLVIMGVTTIVIAELRSVGARTQLTLERWLVAPIFAWFALSLLARLLPW